LTPLLRVGTLVTIHTAAGLVRINLGSPYEGPLVTRS
jgi:hypothetical protein